MAILMHFEEGFQPQNQDNQKKWRFSFPKCDVDVLNQNGIFEGFTTPWIPSKKQTLLQRII